MSVSQGDTLELHIRSEFATFHLSLLRQGVQLESVADLGTVEGFDLAIPDSAWLGCNWPVTHWLPVPESWRPGAYVARLVAGSDSTRIPFVVRARIPGSYGPILVQLSTNTWQAYNRYGGKNLYNAYAPGLVGRAHRVSFHRPLEPLSDGSEYACLWEYPFISFLESQGYEYEVCTNLDVHRHSELLSAYRLFASVGHDEYYSKEMFDALEGYANNGGHLAFFSANTLWWQVRYEGDGRTMVCYKSAALDPLLGVDNARVTVNWHAWPVKRPPAALMGVYYNGSWGITPGPYVVFDPTHWAYAGIQVQVGQEFGFPMVAFEIDSRTEDSPLDLQVIARTERPDLNNGGVMRPAEMVYYERPGGGAVFAGGTVNYAQGVLEYYNGSLETTGYPDPVAIAITNNVLQRLSSPRTTDVGLPGATSAIRVVRHGAGMEIEVISAEPGDAWLYDASGRRLAALGHVGAGVTRIHLDPYQYASGIYFFALKNGPHVSACAKTLVVH